MSVTLSLGQIKDDPSGSLGSTLVSFGLCPLCPLCHLRYAVNHTAVAVREGNQLLAANVAAVVSCC